jgi:hypothetical protein
MSAEAKLVAKVTADTSDFRSKIDGATGHIKKIKVSAEETGRILKTAFAAEAIGRFISLMKDLRKYQEDSGNKIVSDEDLANIESVGAQLEAYKMTLAGMAATFTSNFVSGIKAASAWTGTLISQLSRVRSLADLGEVLSPEGQEERAQSAAGSIEPARVKASKKELDDLAKANQDAANAAMTATQRQQAEQKKLNDLINAQAILLRMLKEQGVDPTQDKEAAAAAKAVADQRKAAGDADKKVADEKKRAQEQEDALNKRLAESADAITEAQESGMSPTERLRVEQEKYDKLASVAVDAESQIAANRQRLQVMDAQKAVDEEEKKQKEKEAKFLRDSEKISTKGAEKEADILAGKDSKVSPLKTGLNALSSIGGQVGNAKQAAVMSAESRQLGMQEKILEAQKETAAAMKELAQAFQEDA